MLRLRDFNFRSNRFEVKKRVGYVPETAELYESLSALEFLELCGRLHQIEEQTLQHRIDVLLDGFGLSGQRRNRLGGYSKGMRQKVLLSSAMLHDPAVLILDEPLTGLDVESAMMTKDLLASLARRGKTILYSSHVLDVVERFLFALNGLPFGNPPESLRGSMTGPLFIAGLIGAGFVVFQRFFIFQSRLLTAGAVVAFSAAAYVVARTSMRYVEVNILHNLHRIATGETGMFKEVV